MRPPTLQEPPVPPDPASPTGRALSTLLDMVDYMADEALLPPALAQRLRGRVLDAIFGADDADGENQS